MNPFLPEDNRAPAIHKKALTFYILVLCSAYIFINVFKTAAPGILGFASNIFVEDIVEATNAYRRENNVSELEFNQTLSQAAQKKAEDMFADGYWAHVAPDGTNPWYFIRSAGYDYIYAGENLAKDFQESGSVVVAWMESPSHRQNVLNDKFRDIGVAVVNGTLNGYETTLVVQMFGQKAGKTEVAGVPTTFKVVEAPQLQQIQTEPQVEILPEGSAASPQWVTSSHVQTRPKIDVFNLTRGMSLVLGSMVLGFFTIDTYAASRRGLVRLSGHTVVHFGLLLLLLGAVWFLKPGTVL